MKIIDLTHTISPDMPVYPGMDAPRFSSFGSYEKYGYSETALGMLSHTGTHIDAPRHIFPGGKPLEDFALSYFVGCGLVIDATDLGEGGFIGMTHLQRYGAALDEAEFLLFHTGWERRWGSDSYFGEYPVIDSEVADYLLTSGKRGVGLDVVSLDPVCDKNLTLHKKLLGGGRDFIIIENLCNLGLIGNQLFTLAALPLKFRDSDGAPARVAAILG